MINIIAALAKNNVIGNSKNELPWYLSEDLKHFRKMTLRQAVIMGRKTFESRKKRLPKRRNVVVTSQNLQIDKVHIAHSLEEALEKAKYAEEDDRTDRKNDVWIIGGAQIFKEALDKNIVDKMYLTFIDKEYDGDILFPEIDFNKWKLVSTEPHVSKDGIKFEFREYEKV